MLAKIGEIISSGKRRKEQQISNYLLAGSSKLAEMDGRISERPNPVASAPNYSDLIRNDPHQDYQKSKYLITGELELITSEDLRTYTDLFDKLNIWVDDYIGDPGLRPIYSLVYVLIGTHLMKRKMSSDSRFVYSGHVTQLTCINHLFGTIHSERKDFSWNSVSGLGESKCIIKFDCTLKPTNRTCVNFMDVYLRTMPDSDPPPFINHILEEYGIELVQKSESDTYFKYKV
ncbi:matrix protein [Drosophila ananassae sigmavirus]|uniref:Matrix protein n=1 Tax=Drosophila ananassae sigmavirus TaxID=1002359 RepID=A0A140D8K8_9RHAB|nr:matrix protein [Drosophila ananassae sigmavirus]AMK09232.1 matrix protein [Drosophila ananassae sigmavirus]